MLSTSEFLDPLAAARTDEVVVTTMSVTRPWGARSSHDLDFASADSAMGHAADLALGVALARPDRRVLCLNGDGSMLMSLGTLATIVGAGATNLVVFVVDNGVYEVTGNQPVAAAGRIDWAGLARATGFPEVHTFDDASSWALALPDLLRRPGPTFVNVRVDAGREGPIGRSANEPARYLQTSLAEWSRVVRRALAEDGTV